MHDYTGVDPLGSIGTPPQLRAKRTLPIDGGRENPFCPNHETFPRFPPLLPLRHDVTFQDGSRLPVFVAPSETFGRALARLGFGANEVASVAVSGPLNYEPDYAIASR